jgi:hypothetical protein
MVSKYLTRPLRTEREAQRDIQRNCDHGADELCQRCDSGIGIDQRYLVRGDCHEAQVIPNGTSNPCIRILRKVPCDD